MLPYRERLSASIGYWTLPLITGVFVSLALLPVDGLLAAVVGAVATAGAATALVRAGAVVEVTAASFRAGTARVPARHVGAVEALDRSETRHALGPGLDARAFACTRPWVATAVRVHLTDPRDPVPYWLVSTRHADRLAGALREAAASGGAQAAHSEQTS